MARSASIMSGGWQLGDLSHVGGNRAADHLLRVVDAGLASIICVAPMFFGGRHNVGRLVLVALIGLTATAWFARQTLLADARWPRTIVHLLVALAAGLLVLQIVPLPVELLSVLSPASPDLLPLWSASDGSAMSLGQWQTLSFTPHETAKALAMLLNYALLFVVVIGRIETTEDIHRLMCWIAFSAAIMAMFGLVQYFTSNGRFFWFYAHPFRRTSDSVSGAFTNRNHFANFLVLGVGPLLALMLRAARQPSSPISSQKARDLAQQLVAPAIGASLVVVTVAILGSCSRGGAVVLLVGWSVLLAIYWYRGIVDSRCLYGLAALAVLVIGLLSLHGYDQVAQRLDDFTEGSLDDIDEGGMRRKLWMANVAAFQNFWQSGTGAGSHSEVYPLFMDGSYNKIYTHAENGYLQVASETGIAGVALLAVGIAVCIGWAATCLRNARQPGEVLLFGAAAAGLAANLAHSLVDFVWYIPACMSVTIVLAGCLLRLSQLVRSPESDVTRVRLQRGRWIELGAAAVMIGAWSVHVYLGPAVAAIYWDRYLRLSVASSAMSQKDLVQLISTRSAPSLADREPLNDAMIRNLEQAIDWDPQFVRARSRLASKYMLKFELSQLEATNAMGLAHVREAVAASEFSSASELQAWLDRAFGEDIQYLERAASEARCAATLCPLHGEAYTYLAELCFLDGAGPAAAEAYVAQALRIRPCDADVLYAAGEQARRTGDIDAAIEYWSKSFSEQGAHQLRIVFWLAGQMPVDQFLDTFRPDWHTLQLIWSRYRDLGRPQDIQALLDYSIQETLRNAEDTPGITPAYIWYSQSAIFADVGKPEEELKCLERAYACDPTEYYIRNSLAQALQSAGRLAEAETHIRWCLARQPADKKLTAALMQISKQRLAQREALQTSRHSNAPTQSMHP